MPRTAKAAMCGSFCSTRSPRTRPPNLGGVSHVYVSLPLSGPAARLGREILRGAELALNGSVDMVVLDSDGGDDREEKAVRNAVRAAEDDRALAYLGDFYSD